MLPHYSEKRWGIGTYASREGLRARYLLDKLWGTSTPEGSSSKKREINTNVVMQWATQSLSHPEALVGSWKDTKIQRCFSQPHYILAKAQVSDKSACDYLLQKRALAAPLLVGLEWIQKN